MKTPMMETPILTARLRLRALAAGDLALFRDLYGDAQTMRHIGRPMQSARIKASLRATLDAALDPRGPRFFVIIERRHGRAVGLCSVQAPDVHERNAEIGIMLRPDARRRRFASEALSALTIAVFGSLPVDTVWVQYRKANRGAERLFDALGFSVIEGWRPHGASLRLCVKGVQRSAISSNQLQGAISMSNVIGFLESAGREAALRHASRERLLQAMEHEGIAPELRSALLQPQRMTIDGLLGVRDTMYCKNNAVTPPKPKKAPAKKTPAKAPPKKTPAKKAPAKR